MSKLHEYFDKMEVNPEASAISEELSLNLATTSASDIFVPLQFESTGGECAAFYKYLIEHREGIILDCEPMYGHRDEISKEFDLVLKFIKHDLETESVQWNPESGVILCTVSKPSVFQCILSIYSHFARFGLVTCYIIREQEEAVKAILGKFKEFNQSDLKLTPVINASYSTLIVTENADLHSASDLLVNSWKNIYVPWVIREVLVQESVASRFKDLISERLTTIDRVDIRSPYIKQLIDTNLDSIRQRNLELISLNGAHIVVGIQRDHLEDTYICVPIITFNAFRTIKEATTLYNKKNGGSASIWSENISESYELINKLVAKNIWVNCNGILDPRCVYEFGVRAYPPGLLSSPFLENLSAVTLDPASDMVLKEFDGISYACAFFDGNLVFNVIAEDNPVNKEKFLKGFALAEVVSKNPEVLKRRFARSLLKKYKTVVVRFGQTILK